MMRLKAMGSLAVIVSLYGLTFMLPNALLPSSTDARFVIACILPPFSVLVLAFIRGIGLWRFCGLSCFVSGFAQCARSSLPYSVLLLVPLLNLGYACMTGTTLAVSSLAMGIILLCAALIEELIFRGFLIGVLLNTERGPLSAVLITSILFACLHLFNVGSQDLTYTAAQFVVTGFIGLGLGCLRLSVDSTWPCVVLHGLINATSSTAMRYDDGMLLMVSIMAAIAGIVSYLWWRGHLKAER